MKKTAWIIVNIGSPEKANKKHVRRYLRQFLNDQHVIDLPWLMQKILVNLIIIPFRTPKSTKLYQQLFKGKTSPLLHIQASLANKLQHRVEHNNIEIINAMRYGRPSLKNVLQELNFEEFEHIKVLPMFPQYASSTTGSIKYLIDKTVTLREQQQKITVIDQFYKHPAYLKAFSSLIESYSPENYDHVLFSFHGLPMRQIQKTHPQVPWQNCQCETSMPEHGEMCYKATCYETTRLLVDMLKLSKDKYSVAFQSRLSKNWLTPFSDNELKRLAQAGKQNVLILAPAFTADCLETIVEIGIEYKHIFQQAGGIKLQRVECLNDTDEWAKAICDIMKD